MRKISKTSLPSLTNRMLRQVVKRTMKRALTLISESSKNQKRLKMEGRVMETMKMKTMMKMINNDYCNSVF